MTIIETRPVTSPVGEGLRRAKALLETEGWCKGSYKDADGRRCIRQAIIDASGVNCLDIGAALYEQMNGRVWSLTHDEVTEWNDDRSRTLDDVYNLLDAAADIADIADL